MLSQRLSVQRKSTGVACTTGVESSDNLKAMAREGCQILDPRIRRTRQLLQQALEKLLETKELDRISVQDIAAAATEIEPHSTITM
jgi:hypothetical protein